VGALESEGDSSEEKVFLLSMEALMRLKGKRRREKGVLASIPRREILRKAE